LSSVGKAALCARAESGARVRAATVASRFVLCSSISSDALCAWKAVSGILWQARHASLSASGSPETRPPIQLSLPLPLLA
jgi:hypothetical protein